MHPRMPVSGFADIAAATATMVRSRPRLVSFIEVPWGAPRVRVTRTGSPSFVCTLIGGSRLCGSCQNLARRGRTGATYHSRRRPSLFGLAHRLDAAAPLDEALLVVHLRGPGAAA